MYHVEEMTQSAIAGALGISRIMVTRLLSDARKLHEVRISLTRGVSALTSLEMALERAFSIGEAIVAPLSSIDADPTRAIAAATGQYLSEFLRPGLKIGVGWGKTLHQTLSFISDRQIPDVSVVSLLGGIVKAKQYNPTEFAWQFSRLLQSECFLFPAPALVDSPETKRALIERCGLSDIFDIGGALDAVLLSAGGITPDATSYRFGYFSELDRVSLIKQGAVGDMLYYFYGIDGRLVEHPINDRVMAIPVESLVAAPHRILTSGGAHKVRALARDAKDRDQRHIGERAHHENASQSGPGVKQYRCHFVGLWFCLAARDEQDHVSGGPKDKQTKLARSPTVPTHFALDSQRSATAR